MKICFCIHTEISTALACWGLDCKEERRKYIEGTVQYKKKIVE